MLTCRIKPLVQKVSEHLLLYVEDVILKTFGLNIHIQLSISEVEIRSVPDACYLPCLWNKDFAFVCISILKSLPLLGIRLLVIEWSDRYKTIPQYMSFWLILWVKPRLLKSVVHTLLQLGFEGYITCVTGSGISDFLVTRHSL